MGFARASRTSGPGRARRIGVLRDLHIERRPQPAVSLAMAGDNQYLHLTRDVADEIQDVLLPSGVGIDEHVVENQKLRAGNSNCSRAPWES